MLGKKSTPSLAREVTVFVGLALVLAVLVLVARWNFPHDDLARVILNSLGSAIFGAGLAFFSKPSPPGPGPKSSVGVLFFLSDYLPDKL